MTNDKGETFGEWLLVQRDREGWVGDLVKAARADPKFPKRGQPEAVRARLREVQCEGDMSRPWKTRNWTGAATDGVPDLHRQWPQRAD